MIPARLYKFSYPKKRNSYLIMSKNPKDITLHKTFFMYGDIAVDDLK